MVSVSWIGPAVVALCVLITAFLVNRFAPKRRPHIRRLVWLAGLYVASVGTLWALRKLGALDGDSTAKTVAIVADWLGRFGIANVAVVLLFDVVLPRVRVEPPAIITDVVIFGAGVVTLFSALRTMGVEPANIAATSAVVTAVLAIGMQATLGNVIGGVALQLDNSIREGDWIQLENGRQGRVKEIRWRHTLIETRDFDVIVVPNATLLAGMFTILGMRDGKAAPHRMWVHFNVDFRYSPADVVGSVEASLRAAPIEGVAEDPPPNCICYDFARAENDSVARYSVRYFLTDLARDDPTSSLVRTRIFAALKRAGIPLAVPAAMRFIEEDDLERRERKKQAELEKRIDALSKVEILRPLTSNELVMIAEGLSYAPFAAGETITRQGAIAHFLYIVTRGAVEVRVRGAEGVETAVAKIEAPGFFGEMGLMTGEPRLATVVALSPVDCYRLDKGGFQKIVSQRPEVAADISAVLALRKVELQMARENCDAAAKEGRVAAARGELLGAIRKFFALEDTSQRRG
ncbi:MAG: mechanosensitive ion channel [Polyangiaceae bacterium]|nr:mechanosensitive ion channel [Polyangiaceae bacterium]